MFVNIFQKINTFFDFKLKNINVKANIKTLL